MNNDTPQIFGDDAHDYRQDAGSFPEQGGEAFSAFDGWAGWGDRVEPVAPDDDYPQPSFSPYEPYEPSSYEPSSYGPSSYGPSSYEREFPQRPGSGPPGYPQGPGYAPDLGYTRRVGYPQDPRDDRDLGYAPDVSYAPGTEYGPEVRYPPDHGYTADLGFVHDAGLVPLMEPLPDPQEQFEAPAQGGYGTTSAYGVNPSRYPPLPQEMRPQEMPRHEIAPPVMNAPLPTRVPPVFPDGHRAVWDEALPPPPAADPEYMRETSDSLTTESLLHGKRAAPGSGWRRSVYRATGGLLRFGESAAEMRRRDLINRVRTPVAGGHHRVAVLSLKGGVGKTTTAVGLGATLATLRGDRVITIDANPDRGTLSDKVRLETAATIRDLLNERDQVSRYADVRAFTSQASSRLEVLASDRDPGVSVAFGAEDYCDAARVLEHFYSICITDCGTGLLHSAMSGVLRLADQIILVSSPSVDGARSASATLDWLEAHNCGDLVRSGVVVLSAIRPKSKSTVDLDRLEHHFAVRCRAVARIPYDPHLEEGAEIELELLSSETAEAYLALAAVVGDGLAWPRRLTSRLALP
jgi:MinD-like ATPase involved in chromosome partitioning or flagellar assembly